MMAQILHIFRKDVRHLWIELTVSLLADAAFVAKVLNDWHRPDRPEFMPGFLSGLLRLLVPFSWCLLVARSVQDESLVGDRQFWITRPYTWRQLLAAKALFAVAFINVPLLICNCILMAQSGFSPLAHLSGLLWIQLSMFAVLVIPTAVISVATATLVQLVLWVVGIAVYVGCVASLSDYMPGGSVATGPGTFDWLPFLALVAACLAIILWQYSQRRAWIARGAIVAIAAVMTATGFIPQPASEVLKAYPPVAPGEQLPFHVALAAPNLKLPVNKAAFQGKKVMLEFPVQASGVEQGSLVSLAGTHVAIRLRDGKEWNSKWESNYSGLWPTSTGTSVGVLVDQRFLEQSKFVPANIDLSLAYTEYREENPRQIIVQPGIFPVEGVGLCWTGDRTLANWSGRFLDCRAPLTSPKLLARYETAATTCAIPDGQPMVAPTTGYAARLNDDAWTPAPVIVPIANFGIEFSEPERRPDDKIQIPGVCPGTPVTISTPVVTQMHRTDITLDGVELSDYVPRVNMANPR
jgi:hypothetical protein